MLLFGYVIGGAITVPGTNYIDYLLPGVFVQSIVFGAANTGVGVANDLQRGLIDRFRSLPMAPSAVLTGRVVADLIRGTFIILVTWGIGLLVGFRPEGSPASSFRGSRRWLDCCCAVWRRCSKLP